MKNNRIVFPVNCFVLLFFCLAVSCTKDSLKTAAPQPPPVVNTNSSFVEEFDNVSELPAKGWIFKNNSEPAGSYGWRQGLYEAAPSSKFPVPIVGFPAYSSSSSPNDFISCDASSVNLEGNISAWLITPPLNIKNGDQITFWARSLDDAQYLIFTTDRMQVLMDTTGGIPDAGSTATDTGTFSNVLLDINDGYVENDLGGFPIEWTKYAITISGLNSPKTNARFAFRYVGTDAGVNGPFYASVVGIDSLSFVSK